MRVLRLKPWNPAKRQLVKTWVHNSVHYKAGIDIGYPGEVPSILYRFENDKDHVIDYLLGVRHHNVPGVLSFEEITVGKKDKDLAKVIQDDVEDRVSIGGKQVRARVEDVQDSGQSSDSPKRRQRPTGKTGTGRKRPERSMNIE